MENLLHAVFVAILLALCTSAAVGFECTQFYFDKITSTNECCRYQCFGYSRENCNKVGCQEGKFHWGLLGGGVVNLSYVFMNFAGKFCVEHKSD